jgi:hypothetical protein
MSFLTERSDLKGSKDKQNAISRQCRGLSDKRNRWQSFSTMFSACFSCGKCQVTPRTMRQLRSHLLNEGEDISHRTLETLFVYRIITSRQVTNN